MRKLKLKRPAPGTVLGTLALVVALAGFTTNAFSSPTIIVRKGDIAKGAVTASALAPGAVHAKALAKGSVNSKALAKGAVSSKALAKGAVGSAALAPDSVTAIAIAPSSIYGGALGQVTTHGTAIPDADESPASGTWTASGLQSANCDAGERLLTGGVVFTNPGTREVGIIESLPFSSGTSNGVAGQITSNAGGKASAEVQAICLK